MKMKLFPVMTFLVVIFLAACGQKASKPEVDKKDTTTVKPDNTAQKPDENKIRQFLYDVEGNYGWETTADDISFDFFKDGRLHIQGPDGEATMWTGSWTLKGDQLTLNREDLGTTQTVTVKIDGEKLVLGDKVYTRYRP